MPQVIVKEAVQVGGKILAPGPQELDQKLIDQLVQNGRGHLVEQTLTVELAEGEAKPLPEFDPNNPNEEREFEGNDPLAEFPELVEAGYTVERARAASDEELMALPKVGRATVRRLREALA